MAAKGYCLASDVEQYLDRSFSAAHLAHCNELIEQAENYIDEETGRAWLEGTQTDEAHYHESKNVYLDYAPVSSVTSITGRSDLGETETALVADEDYEVRDLNAGHVVLEEPASYDRVLVTYIPVATVPAAIKRCTVEIVAQWMQPVLQPGSYGLDSYSLPDLTVRFARSHVQNSIPPTAQRIIDLFHYPTAE